MNGPHTSAAEATGTHVGWVDTAKGLGIILVVLGHVLRGLVAGNLLTPTPVVEFLDAWIYAFHMPLFFVVSGLFLSRSAAKPAGEFAWDKIRTIAYPYFVWSLITLSIKSPLGQIVNQPRTLLEVSAILYRPIEQFWFLYVLFLLSTVFGFLLKFGMRPWAIVLLAALLYPGILPLPWTGWGALELTRSSAIYMALGVIVGSSQLFRLVSVARAGTLAAIVAIGVFILTSLAIFLETPHPHSLDFILAASGTAAVVALAVLANRAGIDSAISFLGRYSLEIFVAHTMVSAAIRIVIQQFWHVAAPAPYILACTIMGLFGPIFVAIVLKRIGFRWAFTVPRRSEPSAISGRNENLGLQGRRSSG
jgi:fucose 4-O-acetylase-like acetyltransferase